MDNLCPLKFNIRTLSMDKIEMVLMVKKDVLEVETPLTETDKASPEDPIYKKKAVRYPY